MCRDVNRPLDLYCRHHQTIHAEPCPYKELDIVGLDECDADVTNFLSSIKLEHGNIMKPHTTGDWYLRTQAVPYIRDQLVYLYVCTKLRFLCGKLTR